MTETLTIRTATSTDVVKVIERGPQGPAGPAGTGLETLTTQGDLLYRGATVGERLPIGTSGQVLKVSNGLPAWANESGAVTSVNNQTGAVYLDGSDINTSASDDRMAFIASGFDDDGANGIYYPIANVQINSKAVYRSTTGFQAFYENSRWHLTDGPPVTEAIVATSNSNAAWPWKTTWPGTVTEATLADVVGRARTTFLFQGDLLPTSSISGLGTAAEEDVGAFASASHSHELDTLDATGAGLGDLLVADGSGGVSWESFISPSAITGTAVVDSDARLSDSRTPTAHAASHASSGSDPLAPSDIGAQSIFATEALGTVTADVTLTAARAKIYTLNTTTSGLRILLPTTNVQTGDVVQIRFSSQNGSTIAPVRGTLTGFFGNSIRSGQQVTFIAESTSGTSWEEAATNRTPPETITLTAGDVVVGKATSGAGTATQVSIGTEENSVARGNHVHGNLTNDGKVGLDSGRVLVTTTAGAVTTLALGTAGQVLTVNSTADGVEFAAASGGGFGEVRFDTSGNYTYTGQAAAGASESSSVWFIRRSEFSSAGAYVSTTTANNVEWDDRLTASYT